MISTKTLARIAGLLYLIVAVGGAFAEAVRTSVNVSGNAAATAANVVQHATLVRISVVADLVDFTCFLGVGLVLYTILRQVNGRAALAMLTINAVSVAIQALNMLNQLGALLVATNPALTAGLSPGASHSLVLLFLEMHRQGYLIAQIFFGGYLLPLGYLVYKSGLFPRALGVILGVAGVGYLADIVAIYASASFQSNVAIYFALIGGLGELLFLLWLLIKGANVQAEEALRPNRPISSTPLELGATA